MFLLLVVFRNPIIGLKAIGFGIACIFSMKPYHNYIGGTTSHSLISEMLSYRLAPGVEEPERNLCPPYTAAHVFARMELYKAGRHFALHGSTGRHIWRKPFGPVTPSPRSLDGIVAVANKMTGYMSLARLGIPQGQRRMEERLVFPRYMRCLLGLFLMDTILGNTTGNEARVLVACLVVWGLMLNWLF